MLKILLGLNFFLFSECSAQSSYLDSAFLVNQNLYQFNFLSADSLVNSFSSCHSKDYLSNLLSANYYWWLIISGLDSPENREKYYENLNESFLKLEGGMKDVYSNDSLYSLITTHAYMARIHSMSNQYFSALKQLSKCIDFVKQSFGKESEYEWFLLTSGLYNYYTVSIRMNYPFLIPYLIFLPQGNSGKGIDFLEQASNSPNQIINTEANYFLMKIYLEEEKKYPRSRIYSEKLIKKYPANLLFRYYHFKSFLEENKISEAAKELGQLKYRAEKNSQLSEKQKEHFISMAREELKKYYLENKK